MDTLITNDAPGTESHGIGIGSIVLKVAVIALLVITGIVLVKVFKKLKERKVIA